MRILLIWLAFTYQVCAATLTTDVTCIPNVLNAITEKLGQSHLSDAEVTSVRNNFIRFAHQEIYHLKDAHVVWQLMAALFAANTKQTKVMYEEMLRSGYRQDSELLSAIGHKWGQSHTRKLNKAENHILRSFLAYERYGSPVLPFSSYDNIHGRLLYPWLFDTWHGPKNSH